MKQKLLITGASGFVGYHTVMAAYEGGYEVHAAVRRSSAVTDIAPFVSKFVYPDFANTDSLIALFESEKYDFVIHAAGLTKAKDVDQLIEVNASYTENLVEAAFSNMFSPKRFVFVSSMAALGPIPYGEDEFITESQSAHPVTEYGRSKHLAEITLASKYADNPIAVIRPTAVYGPRDKDIYIILQTLNRGVDAYIGRKPQRLSFIYVKDLADFLILSLTGAAQKLEYYNISDGQVYDRYALGLFFRELAARKLWRVHVPYRVVKGVAHLSHWAYRYSAKTPVLYPERLNELTAENWAIDITKAQTQLGFQPKYDLGLGLKESIEWYKANGLL